MLMALILQSGTRPSTSVVRECKVPGEPWAEQFQHVQARTVVWEGFGNRL